MRGLGVLLLILMSSPCMGVTFTKVITQEQFDNAVERINNGEEMALRLANKTFMLQQHIEATAPLYIKSKKAKILYFTTIYDYKRTIREEGDFLVYQHTNVITPYSLFYDESGRLINVSESVDSSIDVNLAAGGIEKESNMSAGTIVKIPIPNNLSNLKNRQFDKSFGYFDCGWQTVNFLLDKSDEKFFYCKTLNRCRTGNYSYDKTAGKNHVRFVIYNAERKADKIYYDSKYLYVPKSYKTIYHLNCANYVGTTPHIKIRSDFSMQGVHMIGLDGVEIESDASALCELRDCHFQNSQSNALKIIRKGGKSTKMARITNCVFSECSVLTDNVVSLICPVTDEFYITMESCVVTRYPSNHVGYKNADGGIYVNGNALLKSNIVYNMPRCHLYFNTGQINAIGNVLYNTDEFNAYPERNYSSDLGLVYCNHLYRKTTDALENVTHKIILKNNLLYGAFAYRGDARGIFIDDGRGDVECVENVILNSQLYSMDSRNSSITEAASVRNKYEGNIVTTRYRLAGGKAVEGENKPMVNANLLISTQNNERVNIQEVAEDVRLDLDTTCYCSGGKIMVSKGLYQMIRKSTNRKGMFKFLAKIPQ